ncbi:23S rRNA (guanine(745)-N(1))-methyltransferase [Vibrio agarivorans]|uniref:23S rRNA (guanine(745)-N(1))-methyltransferase n=1 Tax=Vibrio agarivorans TaxID=153622 RepID=UPI00222F1D76|nr:23S rRNA (guanine(745)-N(1))-methyltransferase [Vibrio agarivorans]
MSYQCPLCHLSLSLTERTYRCANNHSFDLAKEGYVNLMPVQHKRSKDPGDNKEMMQARRRFLEHDYYAPLRDSVAKLCLENNQSDQPTILDIGCGEGYYTAYIAEKTQAQVYGLDISKAMIKHAAKRYREVDFTVASSQRLPFADNTLSTIVRIYAPCQHNELYRTLKDQGIIITVTPAARHLYQLRELIYSDVRLHDEQPEVIEGFELESDEKLSYPMHLSGSDAYDLLQMTPFAWKATPEVVNNLKASETFICETDFSVRVYRKTN